MTAKSTRPRVATHRKRLLASAIGLTVASWGVPALAQASAEATGEATGARVLGPVRVGGDASGGYQSEAASSPKQTAPLLDTPQTISVIPQAVIREQGARTLTEVLRNTPGISFNAGENGFSTSTNNFSLRGFDASGSVFIDGARDSGSFTRDVFNVDRVEVVKGPAADNGRGGPGGYVNMVTKTPLLDSFFAGGVSVGFDEYDSKARKRVTLDGNYTVGETTGVRLNAMFEDSGVAGRSLAKNEAWGIAPSVALGLGKDFRAILSYEHVERDDRPDWGVPGATIPNTLAYNPATAGAPRDAFYGLRSDFDDATSDALTVRFEYDFSDNVTVSNQTRWSHVDREARFTVPTGYVPATDQVTTQTQFYGRTNDTLSNFTNLSARFDTGGIRHTLSSGLEFTRERSEADRRGTANPGNTDLFSPDPDRSLGSQLLPTEFNRVKVDTIAFYLYDTVEFSEQWEFTGGLRAENYDAKITSRNAAGNPTGGLDGFEDSNFSIGGKAGLVFKPVENGSIYAAFGTGVLPPGSYLSNPDISRTGDNAFPGFVDGAKPVRSYNYELGVKWDFFDKRLSTALALFHTEKKRAPFVGLEVGETVASLKGYGKQVVQGVEVSVSGQITPDWQVFGGFALMDSKRQHSAFLDEVVRRANPNDYGAVLSTHGDRLAFTPNFTANLWTTYRLPFGLTIGGGVQHVGSSFLGRPDDANRIIPNGRFGKLPAYTIGSLMLSYEIIENLDLRLNIDNVTNEKYAATTNWNGSRATLGTSRTFLVSVDFKL